MNIVADRALITLAAGQRKVLLPFSYVPGAGSLFVSLNGQEMSLTDYVELDPNNVWLNDPSPGGELLEVRNIEEVSF